MTIQIRNQTIINSHVLPIDPSLYWSIVTPDPRPLTTSQRRWHLWGVLGLIATPAWQPVPKHWGICPWTCPIPAGNSEDIGGTAGRISAAGRSHWSGRQCNSRPTQSPADVSRIRRAAGSSGDTHWWDCLVAPYAYPSASSACSNNAGDSHLKGLLNRV